MYVSSMIKTHRNLVSLLDLLPSLRNSDERRKTGSLLSQYRFCAGAVGLGTAYALKYKKGVIPMVAAGAVGTTVDMLYGYFVECAEFRKQETPSASSSSDQAATSSR